MAGPPPPPAHRLLQPPVERLCVRLAGSLGLQALGRHVPDREMQAITRLHLHASEQLMVRPLLKRLLTPHDKPVVAAGCAVQQLAVATNPGPHRTVVKPWGHPHVEHNGSSPPL